MQPLLLPLPKTISAWQQEELHILCALDEQMRWALARSQRALLYLHERGIPLQTALEAGVGYNHRAFNRTEMGKEANCYSGGLISSLPSDLTVW